jgi:hypothetical protein
VETIFEFQELDEKARSRLLSGLSKRQIAEVREYSLVGFIVCSLTPPPVSSQVAACSNRYPEVELSFAIQDENALNTNEAVNVVVQLERDWDESFGWFLLFHPLALLGG